MTSTLAVDFIEIDTAAHALAATGRRVIANARPFLPPGAYVLGTTLEEDGRLAVRIHARWGAQIEFTLYRDQVWARVYEANGLGPARLLSTSHHPTLILAAQAATDKLPPA
jgi:hypothetical protein